MSQQSVQLTEAAPHWVFREIVTRQWWEVGDLMDPTKVKHMAGFYDFRYAISTAWKGQVSVLELPGVKLNNRELAERGNVLSTIQSESDVYVTNGSFTGFGSDGVADAKTLSECRQEKIRLENLLESAKDAHDQEGAAKIKNQLQQLDDWIVGSFVPGGAIKKLNTGDPLDKAVGAARKRKRRAVAQLKDFGLSDMAEHWHLLYCLQPRTFSYCPPDPMPDWEI